MSGVMTRWSQEIDAAQDDAARKALLGRIGVWRATQLSDIAAQRQASAALARLHSLLGNDASAEREARSLVSLCQTHPPAPREDLAEAQKLLRNVGGGKAVVGPRPADDRRERRKKDTRRESGRNSDSATSTRNKVFDERTRMLLFRLQTAGFLDEVAGVLRESPPASIALGLLAQTVHDRGETADGARRSAAPPASTGSTWPNGSRLAGLRDRRPVKRLTKCWQWTAS